MQDRVGTLLVGRIGHARPEDHFFAEGHTARVFHCTRIELRHEELVVLCEWVAHAEGALEELEALLGNEEDVLGIEVLSQRGTAVNAERIGAMRTRVGVEHRRVWPSNQRSDVGGDARSWFELPDRGALLGAGVVADDLPVLRRSDRELEGGLEIGLLEAGIHATRIGGLELRVEVDLAVDRIHEAMQSFAGVHEGAVSTDL